MKGYGQFCPIAKACELLAQRWTLVVVRELLAGGRRFNDIRRGVPLMSPALLAKRLDDLVAAGLLRRVAVGGGHEYRLTPAGSELKPIVEALGFWGHKWVRSRFGPEDLDVAFLMWDIHRYANAKAFPPRRIVIEFQFTDAPPAKRRFWIVSTWDDVDICLRDPGFDVDLQIATKVRTLTRIYMGDLTLERALTDGAVVVDGDAKLAGKLNKWLPVSAFASAA